MATILASDASEANHLDMDEFINFSVTNDSPARPIIMRMNQAAAAAAAVAAANANLGASGASAARDMPSSPFDGEFALLGANNESAEWLNNMGLDSVLSTGSPSSRGSSLDTPNVLQNGFASIDPTRLKEVPSALSKEVARSPAWSLPDLQQSSYDAPNALAIATGPESQPAPRPEPEMTAPAPAAPATLPPPPTIVHQAPTPVRPSSFARKNKRKRQGSLPDIHIPQPSLQQQQQQQQQHQLGPTPRGLQRSMSTGTPVVVTHFDPSAFGQPLFVPPMSSPIQGPLSAPPISQHTMAFANFQLEPTSPGIQSLGMPSPAMQSSCGMPSPAVQSCGMPSPAMQSSGMLSPAMPLLAPQPLPASGHQRAFSSSGLATIPEAPSSAPADVQWTPIPSPVQSVFNDPGANQYALAPPPATPTLPCPSPGIPAEQLDASNQAMAIGTSLRRPNSCPGTSPSHGMDSRGPWTFQFQQQEARRQYLVPQGHQQLQAQQQQQMHPLISPQLHPYPMSASAHFSPLPNCSPQLPDGSFTVQQNAPPPGSYPDAPLSAGPLLTAPVPSNVGIGRPMAPAPAHARRSSDSELAFAMGSAHIGAMLRSTSVPKAIIEPTPVYASQQLPPQPAIGPYLNNMLEPYEQHMNGGHGGIGYGHSRSASPPRKRVASKRVGMCLKPGPKGKPKPKAEGEMTITFSSQPLSANGLDDEPLHSIHDEIPTNLAPVTFEEFRANFSLTPSGTLIPVLGIEAMTERLMYATPEAVVDQCFRSCYTIGSEYNHAAEKQSKFFICGFDECAANANSNSRIFMRKSAVDSHVRTHIGFRPFKCEADPECDARFVRKHDRDRHVATTHRNEKSFLCNDCGQNFARSDALLRHRAKRDACKARTGQI